MNEYEEIDGKLKLICDHHWSHWMDYDIEKIGRKSVFSDTKKLQLRRCYKCGEESVLVPKGYE